MFGARAVLEALTRSDYAMAAAVVVEAATLGRHFGQEAPSRTNRVRHESMQIHLAVWRLKLCRVLPAALKPKGSRKVTPG